MPYIRAFYSIGVITFAVLCFIRSRKFGKKHESLEGNPDHYVHISKEGYISIIPQDAADPIPYHTWINSVLKKTYGATAFWH